MTCGFDWSVERFERGALTPDPSPIRMGEGRGRTLTPDPSPIRMGERRNTV
jgi:hypothetical protein